MECSTCHKMIPDQAKFCPECGAAVKRDAAITSEVAQKANKVSGGGTVVGQTMSGGSDADLKTTQDVGEVGPGGTVVGAVVGQPGSTPFIGGEHRHGDDVKEKNVVDTQGGAFIGGSVTTGGDFVGRDKTVHQSGGAGSPGSASAFDKLFAALYLQVDKLDAANRDAVRGMVDMVKVEAAKGESADAGAIETTLQVVKELAPGIAATASAILSIPGTGASGAVQAAARRVKG